MHPILESILIATLGAALGAVVTTAWLDILPANDPTDCATQCAPYAPADQLGACYCNMLLILPSTDKD